MRIIIDTADPFSDFDRRVLAQLIDSDELPFAETKSAKAEEKPKAQPKKAQPKKAKPEPEPEPEPMAEEPVADEPEEVEAEAEDEASDEDLLKLAVKKATEMVAGGDASKVREALDAAGANRVRELNKDNVRDFFKALS